jgi:hypothetical protein
MFIHLYFNGRQTVTNLDKELFKAFPNLTKNLLTNVLRANTTKTNERKFYYSLFDLDFNCFLLNNYYIMY